MPSAVRRSVRMDRSAQCLLVVLRHHLVLDLECSPPHVHTCIVRTRIIHTVHKKTFCEQRPMAGALAARGEVRQLSSSRTGGRFPARVGSLGSTCAAHAHTRARAHARARPRCTLQNTFPQHCTSTTTALFCICILTCASHSGEGGRGELGWAWIYRILFPGPNLGDAFLN